MNDKTRRILGILFISPFIIFILCAIVLSIIECPEVAFFILLAFMTSIGAHLLGKDL